MQTRLKFTFEEVFSAMKGNKRRDVFEVGGYSFTPSRTVVSLKAKGGTCSECGVTASHFECKVIGDKVSTGLVAVGYTEKGVKRTMTRDHIIPVSKGGANKSGNIQIMCNRCNEEKSNTMVHTPVECVSMLYILSVVTGSDKFKNKLSKWTFRKFHTISTKFSRFFDDCYPEHNDVSIDYAKKYIKILKIVYNIDLEYLFENRKTRKTMTSFTRK